MCQPVKSFSNFWGIVIVSPKKWIHSQLIHLSIWYKQLYDHDHDDTKQYTD